MITHGSVRKRNDSKEVIEVMKIGTQELIIILLIVVVIFGPTQIPKLARMFGKGAKEFKKGLSEDGETAGTVKKEKGSDEEA